MCSSDLKIRQDDGKLDTVALRHASGALLQMGVGELVVIHFPEGGFVRTRKGEDVLQSSLRIPARDIVGAAGAGESPPTATTRRAPAAAPSPVVPA